MQLYIYLTIAIMTVLAILAIIRLIKGATGNDQDD